MENEPGWFTFRPVYQCLNWDTNTSFDTRSSEVNNLNTVYPWAVNNCGQGLQREYSREASGSAQAQVAL